MNSEIARYALSAASAAVNKALSNASTCHLSDDPTAEKIAELGALLEELNYRFGLLEQCSNALDTPADVLAGAFGKVRNA